MYKIIVIHKRMSRCKYQEIIKEGDPICVEIKLHKSQKEMFETQKTKCLIQKISTEWVDICYQEAFKILHF